MMKTNSDIYHKALGRMLLTLLDLEGTRGGKGKAEKIFGASVYNKNTGGINTAYYKALTTKQLNKKTEEILAAMPKTKKK